MHQDSRYNAEEIGKRQENRPHPSKKPKLPSLKKAFTFLNIKISLINQRLVMDDFKADSCSSPAKSQRSRNWRSLWLKGAVWLSSELILGMMGMDTLADYGEFLAQGRFVQPLGDVIATLTTWV